MKIFSIFFVAVALIAAMVGCGGFEEEAVTFADTNLEAAVRRAIDIPEGPIYPSDLDSLTYLDAEFDSIADLTGLECCTRLTELNLCGNQISDVSHVANLTSLTTLRLYSNNISDVSHVANLTSLRGLGLSWNQLSDVSPLANLTSLTWLKIGGNQITDISALANLTNLTYLYLRYNQISDISPLVDNEGLSEGDEVDLELNPLSADSINIYMPELEARGVTVNY